MTLISKDKLSVEFQSQLFRILVTYPTTTIYVEKRLFNLFNKYLCIVYLGHKHLY